MMQKLSAFKRNICHKDQIFVLDPPIIHFSAYVTGGLRKLYSQIKAEKSSAFPLYEYGRFTDQNGQFCPLGDCLLASRYRVLEVVGSGSRGQSAVIVKAKDEFDSDKLVVIKVLHTTWLKLGAQETHCLWRLQVADQYQASNTIRLLNTFVHDDHYCMVFDPLVPDPLTRVFADLSRDRLLPSIRKVALRLLATLGFLKQQNVIHADLKPENILLKLEGRLETVTVIDFGNAMHHVFPEVSLYFQDFQLQTPLYRAPEVMFGIPFGTEIDMWSLGCILAELYRGKPLFPGSSTIPIIKQMIKVLGPFPQKIYQRGKFFSSFKQYTDDVPQQDARKVLQKKLGCLDYLFLDFLSGMLRYDPSERMTPYQAAQHPFLCSELPLGYLLPSTKDMKPFNDYSYKPERTFRLTDAPYTVTECASMEQQPSNRLLVQDQVVSDKKMDKIPPKYPIGKNEPKTETKEYCSRKTEMVQNSASMTYEKKSKLESRSSGYLMKDSQSSNIGDDQLRSETFVKDELMEDGGKYIMGGPSVKEKFKINRGDHLDLGEQLDVVITKDSKELQESSVRGLKRKLEEEAEINNIRNSKYEENVCRDVQREWTANSAVKNGSKRFSARQILPVDEEKLKRSAESSSEELRRESLHTTSSPTLIVKGSDFGSSKSEAGRKVDLKSLMEEIRREQDIVEDIMDREAKHRTVARTRRDWTREDLEKRDNSYHADNIGEKGDVESRQSASICKSERGKCFDEIRKSNSLPSSADDMKEREGTSKRFKQNLLTGETSGINLLDSKTAKQRVQNGNQGIGIQNVEDFDEVDSLENPAIKRFANTWSRMNANVNSANKKTERERTRVYNPENTEYYHEIDSVRNTGNKMTKNSRSISNRCKTTMTNSQQEPEVRQKERARNSTHEDRPMTYSTKTVTERETIASDSGDVVHSHTTTRYRKQVKKRLMFSKALQPCKSHSFKERSTQRKGQRKVEKMACKRSTKRNSGSDISDPYSFSEDSPLKTERMKRSEINGHGDNRQSSVRDIHRKDGCRHATREKSARISNERHDRSGTYVSNQVGQRYRQTVDTNKKFGTSSENDRDIGTVHCSAHFRSRVKENDKLPKRVKRNIYEQRSNEELEGEEFQSAGNLNASTETKCRSKRQWTSPVNEQVTDIRNYVLLDNFTDIPKYTRSVDTTDNMIPRSRTRADCDREIPRSRSSAYFDRNKASSSSSENSTKNISRPVIKTNCDGKIARSRTSSCDQNFPGSRSYPSTTYDRTISRLKDQTFHKEPCATSRVSRFSPQQWLHDGKGIVPVRQRKENCDMVHGQSDHVDDGGQDFVDDVSLITCPGHYKKTRQNVEEEKSLDTSDSDEEVLLLQ